MPQITRYWLSITKRGLKEAAQFMALHKFWVALAPAILAPVYLWLLFGARSVTNLWKIALSAAMGYGTAFVFALLWKLVAVPAAVDEEKTKELDEQKKSAEDRESKQGRELQEKIKQLEDAARMEAEHRKIKISASLKVESRSKSVIMKIRDQFSSHQSIVAHVREVSLMIYNHGEKPVRLRGYKLWKLAAVEASQEITLHEVVSPATPTSIDVTEPLLRVISSQPQYIFDSFLGTYTIRVLITYFGDSKPVDSRSHDFQLICQRGSGTAITITAEEIC
jgi:hypothetical protein